MSGFSGELEKAYLASTSSSSTTSTPATLQQFCFFPKLPRQLQLRIWDFWRDRVRHFFFYFTERQYYAGYDFRRKRFITEKDDLDCGGIRIDFGNWKLPVMRIDNLNELKSVTCPRKRSGVPSLTTPSKFARINFRKDEIFVIDISFRSYIPKESFIQHYGDWLSHAHHLAFYTGTRHSLRWARHIAHDLPSIKTLTIIEPRLLVASVWPWDCLMDEYLTQPGSRIHAGVKAHSSWNHWSVEAKAIEHSFLRKGLDVAVRVNSMPVIWHSCP
ncbi:hypothetical protein F5B19DRAFT_169422 [Rostrohypoxylon terebratum]|nr:hypothetical protein F5B19DRAFT_169422 [Rostrohypoxylon terebratum]